MENDFSSLPNAKLVRKLTSLAKENEALTCTCKGESGADQEGLKSELTLVESELLKRLSFYPDDQPALPLTMPTSVCADQRDTFQVFIDTGEASPELLSHMRSCPGCSAAVEEVTMELGGRVDAVVEEARSAFRKALAGDKEAQQKTSAWKKLCGFIGLR